MYMHIHTKQTQWVSLAKIRVLPGHSFFWFRVFHWATWTLSHRRNLYYQSNHTLMEHRELWSQQIPFISGYFLVRKILFTRELNGLIYQRGKHTKRAWLMSWRWQQHKSLLFMAQCSTGTDAGPSIPFTKALQIAMHSFISWKMTN